MANKSNQPTNAKKPGRTLKEKRVAKQVKNDARDVAHKAWEK